nr:SGNH/GDSL hydrolase family protein [Nocardioides sp. zg-DK7169]
MLLLGVAAAGCAEEEDPTYVALGDSFTSGPLIPTNDHAGGCLRSDHNYPSLVAQEAGLELVDVSCSGARTADLTGTQTVFGNAHPPQLDAVDPDTDVITVGIGGNDEDVASLLFGYCASLGAADPTGTPCTLQDSAQPVPMAARLQTVRTNLDAAFAEIRERAPEAEVIAVGYPQLLPAQGSCPDRLPIAPGDYAWARGLNAELNDAVADAASRAGFDFVDMWAASEGHDICAAEPWVNGAASDPEAALAFHPFAVYEREVADRVLDLL